MRTKGIILLLIIILISAGCLQTNSEGSSGYSKSNTTISVSGEGIVTGVPDRAVLNLGVETRGNTSMEASESNSRLSRNLVAVFKGIGINRTEIKTSTLTISPVYTYIKKEQKIVGYKAITSFKITLKNLSLAGMVIDKGLEAGANRMQGVSFKFSKNKSKELKAVALKEAVEDATSKAEVIAGALNVTLGKPIKVTESYSYNPVPIYTPMTEAMKGVTPVEPGEMKLKAGVNIEYSFTQS
ncbi:MAG TPA: DUF541 domain-containing protein [Euryarchaeota archaeon]|nr:26 kDa periplasmic immunogenic protein precursor [archaeon BMS3Bbin15]HDL15480.1 DUF541 domain-containing protein [Euryarchaeota archaeon]